MSEDYPMSEENLGQPDAELNTSQTAEAEVQAPNEIDDENFTGEELDGEDGDSQSDQESQPDEEAEDVEVEGKTYKVPKAIKPLLLMEKDYRQKTATLAAERREYETKVAAETAKRTEFDAAILADHAKLHTMDASLAEFKAVTQEQWDALKAKDIDQYRELRAEWSDLRESRKEFAEEISTKETSTLAEREQASKEALANLQRSMLDVVIGAAKHDTGLDLTIPNLTKERLGKISEHAGSAYGFSADELSQITDPRILKALDDARIGRLALSKRSKVEQVEASQRTTPAKTVNGAAPGVRKASDATGDALRAEEWMKRRNEDLARRRAKP